ncbi:hypothetical protein TRVL_09822 [Trypanosoma vivax]|nr:hypothetical protein TRVL_09822 [Trypanosoma vivax]
MERLLSNLQKGFSELEKVLTVINGGAVIGKRAAEKILGTDLLVGHLFPDEKRNQSYCTGDGERTSIKRKDIVDCNPVTIPMLKLGGGCPLLELPKEDPKPGSLNPVSCSVAKGFGSVEGSPQLCGVYSR